MVGGSFKAMQIMNERSRISEAKEQVLGSKNAVMGFTIESPSLPSVPVFDQNLSPLKGNQINQIMYVPANNLLTGDICAFTTTNLSVTVNNVDGSARPPITNVAFVIAHGSANRNIQTALNGNNIVVHSPSEQNIDDNTTFVNRPEQYDDIVEWVTLVQLQNEVGCIDVPFRFITDKLPSGKVGVQYPSVSGTAKLEVENAMSGETVSINCTPRPQSGIDFNTTTNGFNFYGTPTAATILQFDCNATVSNSAQSAQKRFSITIDPNYNKETNASCALDSECGGGYCVNNQCSSGLSGNVCIDGGDCVSGYCAGGICTTGSAGASCNNDGNCQSGICVSGTCQTGAFDAPCLDSNDCKSGICQSGLCSGYLGDACTANSQCLSGYCDSNTSLCAIIPSGGSGGTGGDGNGTGGGGGGGGTLPTYTISSISNGSYTLNGGSCKTGVTTGVASGTYMEVFKFSVCDNWWLLNQGLVNNLDSNGNLVVQCNSSGNCD